MKPYLYMPGVPAAGHISSGGWWHPGRIDGCPKCPKPIGDNADLRPAHPPTHPR